MERKVLSEVEHHHHQHRHRHSRRHAAREVFAGMRVGEVLSGGKVFKLHPEDELGDLAEALAVAPDRTALAVATTDDCIVGLATVNDVMRAYFEDVPPDRRLREWLGSGRARGPAELMRRLTVGARAPLEEVAEKMVTNAIAGDCACHHIVVRDEEDGSLRGVLSSQDLVGVLSEPGSSHQPGSNFHHRLAHSYSDIFAPPDAEEAATSMRVRDAMKHSGRVFTCPPSDSIKDALKVLLVTQQNSILVMDESGIYGFVTPRDAVKAFANSIPSSTSIAHLLGARPDQSVEQRMVPTDMRLVDAAAKMAIEGTDHLVVVHPGGAEAVGVLSSLDVVLRTKPHLPLLRTVPEWTGPTVGEVLAHQSHMTEFYACSTTLGEAARLLATTGRTSMMVETKVGDHALLTESELLRAYLDGWARNARVEDLLTTTERQHAAMLQHFQVPPTMTLTEAASLMLRAAEPSNTCHHLVVRAVTGTWLGVFSALDIARALHALPSELEIAKTGADQTQVDSIMKSRCTAPTCRPGDSIKEALGLLDAFGQSSALVIDADGFHGLITARCALQAFADGVSQDETVRQWLERGRVPDGPRRVLLGTKLIDAAAVMTNHGLHHLLVFEEEGETCPAGILSALDVARGIVSINSQCPFVSLGWLHMFGGPTSFSLQAPMEALDEVRKRSRTPELDEDVDCEAHEPARSSRRLARVAC